jgi:hypothetical protein
MKKPKNPIWTPGIPESISMNGFHHSNKKIIAMMQVKKIYIYILIFLNS